MNEELIALIVKGEVEVDQLVEIQVLQSRIVRDDYARYAVFGEEGPIVFVDLWKDKVDFVFKHEFVQIELNLKG